MWGNFAEGTMFYVLMISRLKKESSKESYQTSCYGVFIGL